MVRNVNSSVAATKASSSNLPKACNAGSYPAACLFSLYSEEKIISSQKNVPANRCRAQSCECQLACSQMKTTPVK